MKMNFSKLAWTFTALLVVLSFIQYRTANQLRDQLSDSERFAEILSAGTEKNTNERLELLKQISELEVQLRSASNALASRSNAISEREDVQFDVNGPEIQDETFQDTRQFVEIAPGQIKLIIPEGEAPDSAWQTTEELKSTIDGLDEELSFAIDKQGEEFQSKDIDAYKDFLNRINIGEADRQNILAQLIVANSDGFEKMLHRIVEMQVNGLIAFATSPEVDHGFDSLMLELSPGGVMSRNLSPEQLRDFYEFESNRLSQEAGSPDYAAELLLKLGL